MAGRESKAHTYEGDDIRDPEHCYAPKCASKAEQPVAQQLWSLLKRTLFVVGSSLVVLIAVRNSLTLHLENFWGASGNFWQHQWDKVVEFFDHDDYKLYMYGSMIAQYVMYWAIGFFYILLDATLKPDWFRKYKVQPGTNEPVDMWRLFKAVAVVHFNQTAVAWVGIALNWRLLQWRGYDTSPTLPSFGAVVCQLAVFLVVEEVGFYYAHRLFHHRVLYKHIHKQHHEWQSPISITGIYCHPIEHLIANMMPVMLGPTLLGSHLSTSWLWTQIAQLSTLNAHSGYHLPFFPSPEAHDYHHLKFNQCYGVLGVLDHLHGTDAKFRASDAYPRHVTMLSLAPPRLAFPAKGKEAKLE